MPTQIKVPAVGESIKSVYVADWKKNTGDYCNAGDIICEIETDKASQEIPTEVAGVITTQANIGDELPIGGVLASIDEAGEAPAKSDKPAATRANPRFAKRRLPLPSSHRPRGQAAWPSDGSPDDSVGQGARRGTRDRFGLRHRLRQGRAHSQGRRAGRSRGGTGHRTGHTHRQQRQRRQRPRTGHTGGCPAEVGEVTRKRMSMMRRTIANRLVSAQHEAAMLTTFNEADMSQIIDLRKKCQKEFVETHGVKLGFMSLFVKAVVRALKAVPNVNAAIDGTDIVQYHRQHIGVAISTEKGLVVPVVRDAATCRLRKSKRRSSPMRKRRVPATST